MTYDVAVVGLGAAGSAAAYELARRGCRVLGVDRFEPPHAQGSSHGRTRIIRQAYHEGALYVPLVQRAWARWRELEAAAGGAPLLRQTGAVMIGAADGALVAGARESCARHGLPHEVLPADEARRRFPTFRVPDAQVALVEANAGYLLPERCIEAQLRLARAHGATLRTGERALGWRAGAGGIHLTTDAGAYDAGRLVLAAGAWAGELLDPGGAAGFALPLAVERQVVYWFEPAAGRAAAFAPERCPVYLWEYDPGHFFYGFPDAGDGVKVGLHHDGEPTTAEAVRRDVGAAEASAMRALLARLMPDAAGRLLDASVCLYTNTPDEHFVIDTLPHEPRVILASACSGHGFKFASALGEVLADLATTGRSAFDLTPFRATRFGPHSRVVQ